MRLLQRNSTSEKTIRLQDTASGLLLYTLDGHGIIINALAFSWDCKRLASASDDKAIRIWDTPSGALLQTLKGHVSTVNLIAFSPDGKQLASASGDMTVKL
jgi:WD40 repeat protein